MLRQNAPRGSRDQQQELRQGQSPENKRALRSSPSNLNKLKNSQDFSCNNSISMSPTQPNKQQKAEGLIRNDSSSVRLSRLNENEAAIIFEDRRRQLFEQLTKQIKRNNNSSSLNRSSSQRNTNYVASLNCQNNYSRENTPNQQGFRQSIAWNSSSSPTASIRKRSTIMPSNHENENHMISSQFSDNSNSNSNNWEFKNMDKKAEKSKKQQQQQQQHQRQGLVEPSSSLNADKDNKNNRKHADSFDARPLVQQQYYQQQRSTSRNEHFRPDSKDKPFQVLPQQSKTGNNQGNQKNSSLSQLKTSQQQSQQQGHMQQQSQQQQQQQQQVQSSQLQQSLRRSLNTQTTNNSNNNNNNYLHSMITQGSDIEQAEAFKTALLEAKGHKSKNRQQSNNAHLMNNYYSPKSANPKNRKRNDDDDDDDSLIKIKKKCSLVLVKCRSEQKEQSSTSSLSSSPPQPPLPLTLNTLSCLGQVISTSIAALSPIKQEDQAKSQCNKIQLRKQSDEESVFHAASLQNQQHSMDYQEALSNSSQDSGNSSSGNSSIHSSAGEQQQPSQQMTDNQRMIIMSGLPAAKKIPANQKQNIGSMMLRQSPQQIPTCKAKQVIDLLTYENPSIIAESAQPQEQARAGSNTNHSQNNNSQKTYQTKHSNKGINEKYLYSTSQGFTISKQLPTQTQCTTESNYQSSSSTTFNGASTHQLAQQQQRSISPASGYSTKMLPKAERSSVSQLKAQTHAMILRNTSRITENNKQRLSNKTSCEQQQNKVQKSPQLQQSGGCSKAKRGKQLEISSPQLNSAVGDQSSMNEEEEKISRQLKSQLNDKQAESKPTLMSRSSSERQRQSMTKRTNSGKTVVATSRTSQTAMKSITTTIDSQKIDILPGYIEQVMICMSENKTRDQQLRDKHTQEKSRDSYSNNHARKQSTDSSNRSLTQSPSISYPQSGEKSPLKSILLNGKNSNYSPERLPLRVMSFSKDSSARRRRTEEQQLQQKKEEEQLQRRSEDMSHGKDTAKNKNTNNTASVLLDFRPKSQQPTSQTKSVAQLASSQRTSWQNTNNNNNNCQTKRESANLTSLIKSIIPLSKQTTNHRDNSNRPKGQSDNNKHSHNLSQLNMQQCQGQQQQYLQHSKNLQTQVDSSKNHSGFHQTENTHHEDDNTIWFADNKLTEASQKLYMNYQLLILQAKQSHERMVQQNSLLAADNNQETNKEASAPHKS